MVQLIALAVFLSVLASVSQGATVCQKPSLFFTTELTINCVELDDNGRAKGPVKYPFTFNFYRRSFRYQLRPITLDVANEKIYYLAFYKKEIYQANLDGSDEKIVLSGVAGVLDGLAYDWISGYIYWSDSVHDWIAVASVDGKYKKILVTGGHLSNPHGIAVDPIMGYLFWGDSRTSKIERCRLDGSQRRVLISSNLRYPTDVSLDLKNKVIYWSDVWNEHICSADYDGKNAKCTSVHPGTVPYSFLYYSLAYYDKLKTTYMTDLRETNLKSFNHAANRVNLAVTDRIFSNFRFNSQVRLFDDSTQPTGTSPCKKNPKPCSHFCFKLNSTNYVCDCPLGMTLQADSKTCAAVPPYLSLYFVDAYIGNLYHLTQFNGQNGSKLEVLKNPTNTFSYPVALAYDISEDMIYWSDLNARQIQRMHTNGSMFQVIVRNVGHVEGLAIDIHGGLLYWTNNERNTVEVSKLNGSNNLVLVKSELDKPRDILVDPKKGIMFLTDWGTNPKVEQMNMDGTNRTLLAGGSTGVHVFWPNALTLDSVSNTLYFVDAYLDKIVMIDLQTRSAKVILSHDNGPPPAGPFFIEFRVSTKLEHPFGLGLDGLFVYWTDWKTGALYRVNRYTGHKIELVTGALFRPEDLHAYRLGASPSYRRKFVYGYLSSACKNTCQSDLSSISVPNCPSGYNSAGVFKGCYNCTEKIPSVNGSRCECKDKASCIHRINEQSPCTNIAPNLHVGVRECVQTVIPGYCPVINFVRCAPETSTCNADQDCSNGQKCCKSNCGSVCSAPVDTPPKVHPCQSTHKSCYICIPLPNDKHKCLCPPGRSLSTDGVTCEPIKDACHGVTCQNGGTCIVSSGNTSHCSCTHQYTGSRCETDIRCSPNPCKHKGTCEVSGEGYKCNCPLFTTGETCESLGCASDYCQNSGSCFLKPAEGTKTCLCTPGFIGAKCEQDAACFSNPCKNNGTCFSDFGSSFRCRCPVGFLGETCNVTDPCYNRCQNSGTCTPTNNGYKCTCPVGFSGARCEKRIYYCTFVACNNGGSCVELENGFKCICPTKYYGRYCERYRPCADVDCLYGGTCVPLEINYRCECRPGYSGRHCETNLCPENGCANKVCQSEKCLNGGTCTPKNSENCTCGVYFIMEYCQLSIKNNLVTLTLKLNQGTVLTNSNVQSAIAEGMSGYCQTGTNCLNKPAGRKRRESLPVFPSLSKDDVHIASTTVDNDGNYAYELTILKPKELTGNKERELLSLSVIQTGMASIKDFLENKLGVTVITIKASNAQQKKKEEEEEKKNKSVAVGTGVGIGAVVIIVPSVLILLYLIYRRHRSKGQQAGPPVAFSNNTFAPEVHPDFHEFRQDPRGLPMDAPPEYDEAGFKQQIPPPPLYDSAFPHLQNPLYEIKDGEPPGGVTPNTYENVTFAKEKMTVELPPYKPPINVEPFSTDEATGFENPLYAVKQEDETKNKKSGKVTSVGIYNTLENEESDQAGPLPSKLPPLDNSDSHA